MQKGRVLAQNRKNVKSFPNRLKQSMVHVDVQQILGRSETDPVSARWCDREFYLLLDGTSTSLSRCQEECARQGFLKLRKSRKNLIVGYCRGCVSCLP